MSKQELLHRTVKIKHLFHAVRLLDKAHLQRLIDWFLLLVHLKLERRISKTRMHFV